MVSHLQTTLAATVLLEGLIIIPSSYETLIDESRLLDCVETLLEMQNSNGGYASYEKIRGSKHLELLNPAEVFENIMVEIAYPECTAAVLLSLSKFRQHFSSPRNKEIEQAIKKAVRFIKQCQCADGSWYGSWAICFTYGTYCAIQGLEASGEQYDNSTSVRKACEFLLEKQMEDGGWGEHHSSCDEKRYIQHEKSQVVNTAWAVLTLMHAGYPDPAPIERGLEV